MDIRMSLHPTMWKLSWPVAERVSGIILGMLLQMDVRMLLLHTI